MMLRRLLPGILVCALFGALFFPASARAGNLLAWISGHHKRPSPRLASPYQVFGARPAPHVYPEYNVNAPWYGYGFGVPSYNWGYFGARYRPAQISHRGYYGDVSQWGYRRGY